VRELTGSLHPNGSRPQPIVILGGFLSFAVAYREMRTVLQTLTGQPVFIVQVQGYDWLLNASRLGWAHLLHKLDRTVQQAAHRSATGQIALIGHSIGGVLGRLYLSPKPFLGRAYRGVDYVERLITLGSPHYNTGGTTRGGRLSRWVEQRYPGAYFAPRVAYTAVAGRSCRGALDGSRAERFAYGSYRDLGGDGGVWGDGLIPVASALLQGAEAITLEGVSHFPGFGEGWYGGAEAVRRWWPAGGRRLAAEVQETA
jgi:hypothetical protein